MAKKPSNYKQDIRLRQMFGITIEQYEAMVKAQGNLCAVCKKPETAKSRWHPDKPKNLAVDHSHKTGKIRELLCYRCNAALGYILEDPEIALAMACYIRKHAV